MKLGDQFPGPVVTAGPQDTIASVARLMQQHNVGTVVVAREHKPVGIITDRDLALALGAEGMSRQTEVEKILNGPVRTICRDADIFSATCYMKEYEVRRLPIVDEAGRVVGIVALDDLLRLLGREFYNLTEGIKHEMETR